MRIALVDPSAYTPPYDHALAAALARAGQQVTLLTSRFGYEAVTAGDGYSTRELFYRLRAGAPGSRLRRSVKLAQHVPDMLRLRAAVREADVVHFQWLAVQALDRYLLPRRPLVLTAHDLLPREPRPGQVRAQRRLLEAVEAIIVHSRHGRTRLTRSLGLPEAKVHVVPHGAFTSLASLPPAPLPPELDVAAGQLVVLFFGLLRPYKGVEVLLDAWREAGRGAQLWIVGHPRMPLAPLRARAPAGATFVPRFVSDSELAACFRRADVVVLPYTEAERFDQSGVLATALAFGSPIVASEVGGFGEVAATGAARLVAPGDPVALADALSTLLARREERERMAAAARAAAAGPFSWDAAARATVAVYETVRHA